ncbi:hypothetical protein BH11PSE9_BH11PSE9_36260 [soil metagenome]
MNSFRRSAAMPRFVSQRNVGNEQNLTFLNLPLLGICLCAWGLVFAVAEAVSAIF